MYESSQTAKINRLIILSLAFEPTVNRQYYINSHFYNFKCEFYLISNYTITQFLTVTFALPVVHNPQLSGQFALTILLFSVPFSHLSVNLSHGIVSRSLQSENFEINELNYN